ncbi:dihydroorotase, partial [Candidatus Pacearchaeota archaeon]|nr:dihydroorotase [Candidatus Pacearchaeota archaeon]
EVKEGKLHIQHVSRADSVKLIREAKKSLQFTCETAPHYYLSKYQLNPCESGEYPCPYRKETKKQVAVNPPIGNWGDSLEIKRGLADGTIDCIATDYAPEPHPRKTGIACFENLFNSELIKEGWLSEEDFYTKISGNPRKIISK